LEIHFLHENSKVGRVTFFLKKWIYCLSFIQNFIKLHLQQLQRAETSKRKFNNMARLTTPLFYSVTSISKTVVAKNRAKGLRLHERTWTWSFAGKSIIVPLKEKPTSWKLRNKKYWQHSSPKLENLHLGWASLYDRQASPLTTWSWRWIRKGIKSCTGPPCRPCAG
jgi:hypothetical protein